MRHNCLDITACGGTANSVRQGVDGVPWKFLQDQRVTLMRLSCEAVFLSGAIRGSTMYLSLPSTRQIQGRVKMTALGTECSEDRISTIVRMTGTH